MKLLFQLPHETNNKLALKSGEEIRYCIPYDISEQGEWLVREDSNKTIETREYETTCPNCGRPLPGTRECPKCQGEKVRLTRFWKLSEGYKLRLFIISLFMLVSASFNLILPDIQKRFIDQVLLDKTGNLKDVLEFLGITLIITILSIIINVFKNWWSVSLGARISMDLREKMYHKLQMLSLSYIQDRNLDTESEYLIQTALERLSVGRTTFAIAHRLSTLKDADRLVVIDNHVIAELGTHNELMETKGIYYNLVTAQLEMQAVD